jgi:hypothetical protein
MIFWAGICISQQVEKSFLAKLKVFQLPFSYGVNFRIARGLAKVTYSGTPVGSVVDICHKNEMQCSSFQKFTSFFEHILLQNCLVALPYQPSSQQKCQEVSGLNFPLGLFIFMKTFKEICFMTTQKYVQYIQSLACALF